jgi:hypothetical protein
VSSALNVSCFRVKGVLAFETYRETKSSAVHIRSIDMQSCSSAVLRLLLSKDPRKRPARCPPKSEAVANHSSLLLHYGGKDMQKSDNSLLDLA